MLHVRTGYFTLQCAQCSIACVHNKQRSNAAFRTLMAPKDTVLYFAMCTVLYCTVL
jgi:hypothetical protein